MYATCRSIYDLGLETNKIQKEKRKNNKIKNAKLKNLAFFFNHHTQTTNNKQNTKHYSALLKYYLPRQWREQ
jgi:hypothetical protein